MGEEVARLWELAMTHTGEDATVHVSVGETVLSGCMTSGLCNTFAISSEQSLEEECQCCQFLVSFWTITGHPLSHGVLMCLV